MNKEDLIAKIFAKKADENNTVDLNAYENGLRDMYDALNIADVMSCCYLVEISKEPHVIIAENMANACDKIEKFVSGRYEFVYAKSLPVIQ